MGQSVDVVVLRLSYRGDGNPARHSRVLLQRRRLCRPLRLHREHRQVDCRARRMGSLQPLFDSLSMWFGSNTS